VVAEDRSRPPRRADEIASQRRSETPRPERLGAIWFGLAEWLVFMALDARRFGWSPTPLWAQVLGAALIVAALYAWTEVTPGWALVWLCLVYSATRLELTRSCRR
jgi:hypothetical protein